MNAKMFTRNLRSAKRQNRFWWDCMKGFRYPNMARDRATRELAAWSREYEPEVYFG